jgi:hypothetical protein
VTSALEGGRLSAIRTSRFYPQEYPGTHFMRLNRHQTHGFVPSDTTDYRVNDKGIVLCLDFMVIVQNCNIGYPNDLKMAAKWS